MNIEDSEWLLENYRTLLYWDYYEPDFPWSCSENYARFLDRCRSAFLRAGFSDGEAAKLVDSGFIVVGGNVIDRYYGGLLLSSDFRSRVPLDTFGKDEALFKHGVQLHRASSVDDLRRCVDKWQERSGRQLLFRGQTASYEIQRPYQNPAFLVEHYGEISLLPSLWRKAQAVRPVPRQHFRNLYNLEWDRVLRSSFNMADVEARIAKARAEGYWIQSAQDLGTC